MWRYVYRAVGEDGQIIDAYVSKRRDLAAARRFFGRALSIHGTPNEVITDRAPALGRAVSELIPTAFHNTEKHANNRVVSRHLTKQRNSALVGRRARWGSGRRRPILLTRVTDAR